MFHWNGECQFCLLISVHILHCRLSIKKRTEQISVLLYEWTREKHNTIPTRVQVNPIWTNKLTLIIQLCSLCCPEESAKKYLTVTILMKWAGHIARMKDNRWTKRCTEWQPRRGKRSRGRPSRRWQDDITEKEGTTWIRKATDRRQWKTLMEGYILQWMDKA